MSPTSRSLVATGMFAETCILYDREAFVGEEGQLLNILSCFDDKQGFEAIRQLVVEPAPDAAETNYKIILGCRDVKAAQKAYEVLNISSRHQIHCLPLELSSLKSTIAFAESVINELGEDARVDVLLLCAGISKAASEKDRANGKWSEAFIVNYAAQQYLMSLLESTLRVSQTRVIFVTSMLYKKVQDTDQLEAIVSSSSTSSPIEVYRSTKFIQLTSIMRWQERLKGSCSVIAVSPGFVPATGLSREVGYMAGLFMKYVLPWAPFATSLRDGGQAILRSITLPNQAIQEHIAKAVLSKNGEWEGVNDTASNPDVIQRWWLSQDDLEALA